MLTILEIRHHDGSQRENQLTSNKTVVYVDDCGTNLYLMEQNAILSDQDVSIKKCYTVQHQNIQYRAINAGGSSSGVFSSIQRPFANKRNIN